MSHFAQMYVSCHAVLASSAARAKPCRSHLTSMNESYYTYERFIGRSHSACKWWRACETVPKSRHTYGWVMAHIWMSHVTHMIESYHTALASSAERAKPSRRVWARRTTVGGGVAGESCHACNGVMTYAFVRLTYGWVVTHTNDLFAHINEFFAHMKGSCRAYAWIVLCIWMSHVTSMSESCRTHERVMSHIWICHVTCIIVSCQHMNESCQGVNASYHTCGWVKSQLTTNRVAGHLRQIYIYKHICVNAYTYIELVNQQCETEW